MKSLKFLPILIAFGAIGNVCSGQNAAYKLNATAGNINSTAASASNVTNAVGNTANTVKNTVGTLQQVGSMFKKKEKAPEPVPQPAAAPAPAATPAATASGPGIMITISGIDYGKLKQVEDAIKVIEGVKGTSKKFSTTGSSIEVAYGGKDDQLWDALPEATKATLTLLDLGSGKIVLEQKK